MYEIGVLGIFGLVGAGVLLGLMAAVGFYRIDRIRARRRRRRHDPYGDDDDDAWIWRTPPDH